MTHSTRAQFVAISLLAGAAFAAQPPAADTPLSEEVVSMPELEVRTTAYCNFGFGIKIVGDAKAGTISRIFVDGVLPNSEASRLGITDGDEILAVNGKRVSEMKGGMKGGGDLFRLLINRPPGERIDVEVAVRVVKKVVLTAGPGL